jgi:peptide/nickel transport system permease protein
MNRVGAALVVAVATLAVLGPLLVSTDPLAQDLTLALASPSAERPLGTDPLGRDVLARVVHGAPRSVGLAVGCVALATITGLMFGLVSAFAGGWIDVAVMRLADLTLAFPGMLLALSLAGLVGGGIAPMAIGLTLTYWPQYARIARAIALGTLAEPHVEAARLAGFGPLAILSRHVIPPVLAQTLVLATLGVGTAVMSLSALGFLGLGLRPPTPEWGAMIAESLPYLTEAPIQVAAPCLGVFATVLGFTLVGRSLAEAVNRQRDQS